MAGAVVSVADFAEHSEFAAEIDGIHALHWTVQAVRLFFGNRKRGQTADVAACDFYATSHFLLLVIDALTIAPSKPQFLVRIVFCATFIGAGDVRKCWQYPERVGRSVFTDVLVIKYTTLEREICALRFERIFHPPILCQRTSNQLSHPANIQMDKAAPAVYIMPMMKPSINVFAFSSIFIAIPSG